MLRRLLLPVIFAVLAFGFWISPSFKEIAAGVAIFLFGMLFLEEGFRAFTGGLLERLLKKTTDRLWKAIAFGIVSTSVMQSSSLVSVITISFLSAGLIWLSAGIGIIFGANVGTTTGAWIIAGFGLKVNIAAFAMPMLVFGIILIFQKAKYLKGIGYALAGLGFLFLGIHYMKGGFEAFRERIDLAQYAIPGYIGLFVFTLIGGVATVIMQSSHATLVLIITALAAEQITYENALALAIGANIGTTITAILGAMSSNYLGKRLAAAHVIFNALTGIVTIVLIAQIVWVVDGISAWAGIAADDYTLKLAVFHTVFNVMGVLIMIPWLPKLVEFLQHLFRKPPEDLAEPKYINEAAFDFPETLLGAVREETIHLYKNAFEILAHGLGLHRTIIVSNADLEACIDKSHEIIELDIDRAYTNKVKVLHAAILEFITKASISLPPTFADHLYDLRDACQAIALSVKDLERMRENVMTYIRSDNPHIRRQYNWIRLQLAQMMRAVNDLATSSEEERDVLALDELKAAFEEGNVGTSGALVAMIREGKITSIMATSLMNDIGYAHNIVWNLAKMAETLYGAKDVAEKTAEKIMVLTDQEIEALRADQPGSPTPAPSTDRPSEPSMRSP